MKEINCKDCRWYAEDGCQNVNAVSKEMCYEEYEDDFYDEDIDTQSIFFVVLVVICFVTLVVAGVYLMIM